MSENDLTAIGIRSVQSVLALISRTFLLNVISLGASLIVFTILTPSQVGIYTGVLAMQRVISFLTDFGLGAALVQKRSELEEKDLVTSFTIQSLITLVIFIAVFLLRGYILSYFHLNNEGLALLLVLVFSIFLSSFKTIPSILLERKIHFHKLIIPQIAESLTFNIILIVLVLKGSGVSSFSWAFLASSIIGIPIYFLVSPWRMRVGIYKESLQHLRYGLQFQAKNILGTVKDDLLTVILIKFLTFAEIGYIGFAQKLAFFAYRYIVDSVTKVTFSTYARIQDNLEHLKSTIEKSLFFVSVTMFPVLLGIIVTVPYLIAYFPKWHNKWEPAVLSLIFFCLNALVSSFSNVLVTVLDATGRVKTTLKLMIMWTTLTWVLTPILIKLYGYNGVAIASFLVTLTIVITVVIVRRVVEFDLLRSVYKPCIAAIIMIIPVFILEKIIVHGLISLVIVIGIGAVLYLSSLYILAKNELKSGIKLIRFKQ